MPKDKEFIRLLIFSLIFFTPLLAYSEDISAINSENILQGIANNSHDQRSVYTLEHSKETDSSFIYSNNLTNRKMLLESDRIGHQGFSVVQNSDGSIAAILTSSKIQNQTLAFIFHNEGNVVLKTVRFFDDYPFIKNDTMPTKSINSDYLVVRGREDYRKMIFKVYSLNDALNRINSSSEDDIDLTKDYKFKWNLPASDLTSVNNELQPLQAISVDRKSVYLLFGDSSYKSKALYRYSIKGEPLDRNDNINYGMGFCGEFDGRCFYEPEGFISTKNNKIFLFYVSSREEKKYILIKKIK